MYIYIYVYMYIHIYIYMNICILGYTRPFLGSHMVSEQKSHPHPSSRSLRHQQGPAGENHVGLTAFTLHFLGLKKRHGTAPAMKTKGKKGNITFQSYIYLMYKYVCMHVCIYVYIYIYTSIWSNLIEESDLSNYLHASKQFIMQNMHSLWQSNMAMANPRTEWRFL